MKEKRSNSQDALAKDKRNDMKVYRKLIMSVCYVEKKQ